MTTPAIRETVAFEDLFLQDKIERRAYEQREKAIRDHYSYMHAYKEDGLVEGREQGLVEGFVEGREQGRVEGLVKGRGEHAKEMAKIMLKDKQDMSFITKYTGLSVEEIEKIELG